jgi:hypothetical protein
VSSCKILLALCALTGSWIESAAAQETFIKETLGATGSLRGGYFSEDRRFTDDKHFLVGSAWLTLRPEEVLGTKIYFDGFIQGEDLSRSATHVSDVRETYLDRSFGDFDFRVGRQIIVWGRADKINPTDNLSVRDFRRLMTDDEDQRTGVLATQLTWNIGEERIKAIWLPEWRSPKFPFPPVAPGLNFVYVDPKTPIQQYALKWDHMGSGGFDASFSYFHGYSKIPDLSPKVVAGGVDLELLFPLIQTFGFDAAWTMDRYGLRVESAYTLTPDNNGRNVLAQNPFLFTVFGVERSFDDQFSVNVQYLNRWVQGYSGFAEITDPTLKTLALQSAITTQQLVGMNHGVSVRPSAKFMNEILEAEIAWIHWFTTGDHLVRPKVAYALTDAWKLIAGVEWYSGPTLSFFGRIRDTSTGFLEARFNF